jgi:FKBP-type peptidyl-prolyl cis-trans isomerase
MKKTTVFLCLFLIVTSLYARAIQEDYSNAEEKARVSYAFGMAIGSNYDLGSLGIDFDYAALTEGIRAMVEGREPMISEQEAMEIIEAAMHDAMEKVSEGNRIIEEEFLARNSQRSGVQVTPSGLQYEVIRDTEGEKPTADAVVRVNYTGTFIDGSPFDSSSEEGGAYIPLELVIPGWTEGIMLMGVGSSYRFFIPSNLAYGSEGIPSIIPPYSTLIFMVDLLGIINPEEAQ